MKLNFNSLNFIFFCELISSEISFMGFFICFNSYIMMFSKISTAEDCRVQIFHFVQPKIISHDSCRSLFFRLFILISQLPLLFEGVKHNQPFVFSSSFIPDGDTFSFSMSWFLFWMLTSGFLASILVISFCESKVIGFFSKICNFGCLFTVEALHFLMSIFGFDSSFFLNILSPLFSCFKILASLIFTHLLLLTP